MTPEMSKAIGRLVLERSVEIKYYICSKKSPKIYCIYRDKQEAERMLHIYRWLFPDEWVYML